MAKKYKTFYDGRAKKPKPKRPKRPKPEKAKIKYVVETAYLGISAKTRIPFDTRQGAERYKDLQLRCTGIKSAEIIEEKQ